MAADLPTNTVWQDREIEFSLPVQYVAPRKGEFIIDELDDVEDTKGNNGERGTLRVTNLRLIWFAHRTKKVNLSVGLKNIISMTIRSASSRLRGVTQALYVLAKPHRLVSKFSSVPKHENKRYEFIFTYLVPDSPRLFTTVQAVHRAYDSSKMYRELKLRGAIIQDKQLIMLPTETLYSKVNGVWNLSSDQGNLGHFFITSVRLVWHAALAENFNVSIPYMQIKSVRIRDSSKFGMALVVETAEDSGGFVLGFRVDPVARLKEVAKEIVSLFNMFSERPNFGVQFSLEDQPEGLDAVTVPVPDEDVVIAQVDEAAPAVGMYLADGDKNTDRPATFAPELGLAIEDLREGVTLEDLWTL
ncbi:bardet-Biedl syndrome 5 protein [Thecamonas trahens ATCC 50062]|uniref:Bardet-Biedl syndrome 5 protein n=1 Tax=Thecamonas trahens ATCC 50062 TaxID=461836 RepID=A0A0L0D5Q7_THETB|nr:bardet-Biedl syndrome 5 protein [Thecamonas trahens ATCC 50062]KNC47702.1 bardet-Biedl syndrome 5 protein [Thecamonas trahens ATCC 50062]|eukprot:XP_013759184.1 bardet-Biedl syndrome 5 protein [Thecamonas trahens ATCC 50062]